MERHIQVARTARYHVLGDEGGAPDDVWFVLHGYQQLAGRFINRFRPLDDGSRLVVAPEALSRFYTSQTPGRHGPDAKVGATWLTRADRLHEIRDSVPDLDALADHVGVHGERRGRVTVLGFSQGVATAARWVTLGKVRPQRLILWGDHLPPDLDMERAARAWRGVDLVLVRGRRDTVFEEGLAAAERRLLADAGIVHRTVEYDGGHEIDPRVLMDLAASPG
jgi:predicted esterase